jgi:carbon starvation protein
MSTVTSPYRIRQKMTPRSMVVWGAVAVAGAVCWTVLALARGENVSALWILFAALSSYAIAYRFYARFITYRVLGVDNTRATPAERPYLVRDPDVQARQG